MKRIFALLLALASSSCFPSIRQTFAGLTYPETPPTVPARDLELSTSAALIPILMSGFENPAAAGACYDSLAVDPGLFPKLETLGGCLAHPPAPSGGSPTGHQDHWLSCMNAHLPFLRSCEATLPAAADRAQAALVLANLAEAFHAYRLSKTEQTQVAPLTADERSALITTLELAAKLSKCDPSNADPSGACDLALAPTGTTERPAYPALALSGGSANGAFSAGFLYALLGAREEALAAAAGDPTKITALEAERFGESTGTSIGTLISLLLDLYFTALDPTSLPPGHPALQHLSGCLMGGPLPARAAQQCALAELERHFTRSNEWDVLCVEKGDFTDLLDELDHMVRFDPLEQQTVRPFLRAYGDHVLQNDFIRVAMTVDFRNNLLVGLDERTCRLPGMPAPEECLGTAVLASIVLPAFVQRVPKIYYGLNGASGKDGFWLDGGIRSKMPALQAASLTRITGQQPSRVLALNNSRAEGIPQENPKFVLGVTFATMNQFAHQVQSWEMATTALYAQIQRARGCYLSQQLGYGGCTTTPTPPPSGARVLTSVNRSPLGGSLMPVFVPEHVPSYYAAAGYAFDPTVMTGLFYWGQKTFLDRRQDFLSFLGWSTVAQEANTWMTNRAQQVDLEVSTNYTTPPSASQIADHNKQRSADLQSHLPDCQ